MNKNFVRIGCAWIKFYKDNQYQGSCSIVHKDKVIPEVRKEGYEVIYAN